MAAAGPAMSLVLAVVFFGLSLLLAPVMYVPVVLRFLAYINAMVLIFNLVPGFPLDGGRLLRAAIWLKTGDVKRATRIASRIGSGFAAVLIILGVFVFIVDGSLIHGVWLVLIGFFLRQAARSGYLIVTFKQALGNLRVADVMRTGIVTVDADLSLSELVDDYFLKYHFGSFPVVSGGMPVGLVSLRDVKRVGREQWGATRVAEVMDDKIRSYMLHPFDPAERLLHLIMKKGHGRVPVIDETGRLVGIVTRRDLMEVINMMSILQE
jgi:CBS domain-containing protein